MKITLLANHSVANVGDHAILQETLKLLYETFPGAAITLVFNEPDQARAIYPQHHVIGSALAIMTSVNTQGQYVLTPRSQRIAFISRMLWKTVRADAASAYIGSSEPENQLLAALLDTDLVLGCGGGYICSEPDEIFGWFTLLLLPFMIAHLRQRPLVLLPQSIGPIRSIRQRILARWVVQQARLTLVRERISLRFLQDMGIDQRAIAAPDIAFGMQSGPAEKAEAIFQSMGLVEAKRSLLIGVTAITWQGQSPTFNRQAGYELSLLDAVNTLTSEGALILFFPQCTGPSTAEDDRLVAARIMAQAKHPERLFQMPVLDPPTLQAAYGMLDLMIGTRMHSVILSANAGTAAVAIGYQPKTAGVLEDMQLGQYGLEIESVTGTQIVATVHALLRSDARHYCAAYVSRALRFKRVLREILRGIVS